MSKSKALDMLDSMDDEDFAEQPDPADPALIAAVNKVTAAVKSIPAPKDVSIPEGRDYSAQFREIAAKMDRLLVLLSRPEKPEKDDAAMLKALSEVSKGQRDMIKLLSTPKEFIYDDTGEPVGIKPMRVN